MDLGGCSGLLVGFLLTVRGLLYWYTWLGDLWAFYYDLILVGFRFGFGGLVCFAGLFIVVDLAAGLMFC